MPGTCELHHLDWGTHHHLIINIEVLSMSSHRFTLLRDPHGRDSKRATSELLQAGVHLDFGQHDPSEIDVLDSGYSMQTATTIASAPCLHYSHHHTLRDLHIMMVL